MGKTTFLCALPDGMVEPRGVCQPQVLALHGSGSAWIAVPGIPKTGPSSPLAYSLTDMAMTYSCFVPVRILYLLTGGSIFTQTLAKLLSGQKINYAKI